MSQKLLSNRSVSVCIQSPLEGNTGTSKFKRTVTINRHRIFIHLQNEELSLTVAKLFT